MSPLRVVVAGGGVAAMEAILALRELAGERVELTMLAPESTFAYRPMAVAVPFARGRVQRLPLAEFARETSTRLVRGSLTGVATGHAISSPGPALPHDALLVAVGARPGPAIPGALRFTGRNAPALHAALEGLGPRPRVLFTTGAGVGWTLPLYELALLAAARHPGASIAVVTPEPRPAAVFGPVASREVAHRLAEAGVELRAGHVPEAFEDGRLWLAEGG